MKWGMWYSVTGEWVKDANRFFDPSVPLEIVSFATEAEAKRHIQETVAPELRHQYSAREIH
jgi:hypothetical protein